MPSVSQKQHIAMLLASKGKSNIGIPQSVGQEYVEADKQGALERMTNPTKPKRKRGVLESFTK